MYVDSADLEETRSREAPIHGEALAGDIGASIQRKHIVAATSSISPTLYREWHLTPP